MHQEGDRPGKFRARRKTEHTAPDIDGLTVPVPAVSTRLGGRHAQVLKFKYVITYNDGPRDTELKLGNEPDEKHVGAPDGRRPVIGPRERVRERDKPSESGVFESV